MREGSAQGLTMGLDKRLQHCKEYHLGVINGVHYINTFTTVWGPEASTGVWDTRKGATDVVSLKGGGTSQK